MDGISDNRKRRIDALGVFLALLLTTAAVAGVSLAMRWWLVLG
ncbi:MAG: hypothetical protein ACM3NH_03020 [Candidatus Saccharibacteria bacterium]